MWRCASARDACGNIVELVREQIELTPATRARMAKDATRVVTIVRSQAGTFRNVARHAYESIVEKEVRGAEGCRASQDRCRQACDPQDRQARPQGRVTD